jgi:hypothetical protein
LKFLPVDAEFLTFETLSLSPQSSDAQTGSPLLSIAES